MKKLVFCALALLMLLCQTGCQSLGVLTTETFSEESAPETTITVGDQEIRIPQGFSAGFGRTDITPAAYYPIKMNSTTEATSTHDKLYVTVVAVADGDEIALLIHTDLKRTNDRVYAKVCELAQEVAGISADHVMITATHTHNAPETDRYASDSTVKSYMENLLYPRIKQAIEKACLDLTPATAYGGEADTTGFAFVRRYICKDGSIKSIQMERPTGSPVDHHESEADPQLQTLQFKREGKKDIVLVNWQAHVAHAAGTYKNQVTSDLVGILRDGVERQLGVNFAYFNGAEGNLNLSTNFRELVAYDGYGWQDAAKALVPKVKEAVKGGTLLETGEIHASNTPYTATNRIDDPERIAQAKEVQAATGAAKTELMDRYVFQGSYDVNNVVNRSKVAGQKTDIPVVAITFGDIAFAGAGFEMFDTNGMEIKAGSPFKLTFVCACTNGSYGYIPSYEAFGNGGYETNCCRFQRGTGEEVVAHLLNLMKTAP